MANHYLTVSEAASHLKVSRRRVEALIQARQLPSERRGWQWMLPLESLSFFEHNRHRGPGKPLSQRSAWNLINEELNRNNLADGVDLDYLRRRLRSRAMHRDYFVHPSLLKELMDDPEIFKGGRFAADRYGIPVDLETGLDLYVRKSDADLLVKRVSAREVLEGANLYLHVVADESWPFPQPGDSSDAWVAWLDLADRQDRNADVLLDRLGVGRASA